METMILPDYPENDEKISNYHFQDALDNEVEITSEVYDIVIVDNWQTEQQEMEENKVWCDDGELLAEIYVDQSEESPITQATQSQEDIFPNYIESTSQTDSDDCINLSWLLNFRLDDIIDSYGEESTPNKRKDNATFGNKNPKSVSCPSPTVVTQTKPPYTYTKLIELALREKGELTVSGIYQWISERFPFFKPYDDRWKNSVRHNLSISPHFRKGAKASRGAGHLWTVATPSALDRQLAAHKRQEKEPTMEQEVEAAAASILQHDFMTPVAVEQVATVYDLFNGPLSYTY